MKNTSKINKFLSLLPFLPGIVSAQTGIRVQALIMDVYSVVYLFPIILYGLCIAFFFWGVADFILKAGDEKSRSEGKRRILWSVIAIFVFSSIWGIIRFLANVIGVNP